MSIANQDISPKIKKKKKHNMELKILRMAAGYNSRLEFVDALNNFLEKQEIDYRVRISAYNNCEMGITPNISLHTAYYISKFLECSIEIFIDKKICN